MEERGSKLAARFRKAAEDREVAQLDAADSARQAKVRAAAARKQLLEDLLAFGKELGVVSVGPDDDGVLFRYRERFLFFGPDGDSDRVRIEFEGMGDEVHYLFRQAELGDRWVYSRKRGSREDRVPLFDAGLEHLLVRGLGMPAPGEAQAPSDDPKKRL